MKTSQTEKDSNQNNKKIIIKKDKQVDYQIQSNKRIEWKQVEQKKIAIKTIKKITIKKDKHIDYQIQSNERSE